MSNLTRLLNIRDRASATMGALAVATSPEQGYAIALPAYRELRKLIDPDEVKDPTDYGESTPAAIVEWVEDVLTNAEAEILAIESALDLTGITPDPVPVGLVLDTEGSGD